MREVRRVAGGLVGLAAIAALTGCGGNEEASAGPAGRGGPGMGDRVVPVEVVAAENGRIARAVTVSGNIEPLRVVAVNAQLAGALRTVAVEEGTYVQAGALLAAVDDREIAAQLASAEAAYEVAAAAFGRAERLRERQVITAAEYERDRAALAAAEAQRDQLRARLGYATVSAPISGVILEKQVEAGDVVGVQTRLFTIADVSTLVVRVQVSELDVVEIRQGDAVGIELDALAGERLTGRVRRIFPAANPTTRLLPVEVALTGPDAARVRPGFLARVTFALNAKENVILVPASAIVRDATSEGVYVVQDDRARRRAVRTGMVSEGRVEIVQGLAAGEVVVVTGTNQLRDGATVRVVGAGAAPAERQGGMTP
jgi:membrane fusion protein, multidrug efflux system